MERDLTLIQEVLNKIRTVRADLVEKYTVLRIGVFGSFAKNNASKESDVDILVKLDEPTFDHYMDLKFYLEEILERPVDLVLSDTIKPRLKATILQEVVYA